MPATVNLEITEGPIKGRVFSFDSHDTFLFGRGSNCHARIRNDGYVSRHQFILEVNPPDARLRDLGSRNGTYVNGVKYGGRAVEEKSPQGAQDCHPAVDLKDGDLVTVGKTSLRVTTVVPACCSTCGVEITEDQERPADRATEESMCAACRERAAGPGLNAPPRTIVESLTCQRCGKDVSAELGSRRRGEYLCIRCREDLLSQSGGLRKLMLDAANRAAADAAPRIAGIELGGPLAKGGMGVVYRGTRQTDGTPVAVKVMLAKIAVDENGRRRFAREIEITRALRHRNIVKLIDHGSTGCAFYFVMEFCGGGNLEELRKRHGGRINTKAATRIMLQCLEGLAFAHRKGFVHRDLKPQNILLHEVGGKWTARIGDFGLARNFDAAGFSGMTATGQAAGTYPFMPREQLTDFKNVRPASDVWSIAATFYFLLTGRFPREYSGSQDELEIILNGRIRPIGNRQATIPNAVGNVIDRALSVDPAARYQDAGEMRHALVKAL